jgi:hypothetical protein
MRKNIFLVIMAAGTLAFVEIFGLAEDTPHTHVDTDRIDDPPVEMEPSQKIVIRPVISGPLGDPPPEPTEVHYTLTLSPKYEEPLLWFNPPPQAKLPKRLVIHKIGHPDGAVWGEAWMDGNETDVDKLQNDLATVLHLPAKQIETVMTALKNGHEIAIGNEEANDADFAFPGDIDWVNIRPVVVRPKDPLYVPILPSEYLKPSLKFFSQAELESFGMKR